MKEKQTVTKTLTVVLDVDKDEVTELKADFDAEGWKGVLDKWAEAIVEEKLK